MMAVDSKQGGTTNGANGAASANGAGRRKRPSQLQAQASVLPTVEHSLEEFIAKANQTLVDVSSWGSATEAAREEDEKRREVDALRWKAAEGQLREGEAREQSLRRQLDGLQGKLAEAEARAAVAGTAIGSAAHDQTLVELKAKIDRAEHARRAAEERTQQLSMALSEAKNASLRVSATAIETDGVDERLRIAEAKAAKAIAAAKAAQAGLTVSSADIAAIESGLVVTDLEPPKSTPWLAIVAAFVGGLAIMFVVWKFALSKNDKQEAAPAAQPAAATAPAPAAQPAATTPPPAPTKPVVTPIEEPGKAPAAAADTSAADTSAADKAAADKQAAEDKAAAAKAAQEQAAADKAAAAKAAQEQAAADKSAAKAAAAEKAAAAKAAKASSAKASSTKATSTKATSTKATKGTVADPFADTPAPKKPVAKPAEKKPSGGVVDPF
jgi:hypothetical protein